MTSQLRQTEAATKGVRRILRKQVGKALESLTSNGPMLADKPIHDARKRLKKVRAALRLLREALGSSVYQQENAYFRDAARPLTEVRDATVLVDTLDQLAEHFKGEVTSRALDGLRQALVKQRREVRQRVLKKEDALRLVKESLEAAQGRLAEWSVGSRGWSVVGAGLKRIYQKGRDTFITAQKNPSVENLHEWRKQVKYLWHQLEMLQPMWPPVLEELAAQAHTLGDRLGDDHDLDVLRQKLFEEPERFPDRKAVAAVVHLIDRRRAELQEEALPLGRRFYEEKPKRFADRLQGYWDAWRAEAPAEIQ
jgi:CHAD domain-containing protein